MGAGATPLCYAVRIGQYDIALALLEKGADPNIASHNKKRGI